MQHTDFLLADPSPSAPIYLELSISDHKTKGANAWRGGLLAAVAPAVVVSPRNWAVDWLQVRKHRCAVG